MNKLVSFSDENTYIIYYSIIFMSTFFAFLSDKFAYKKNGIYRVNKIFWCISFLILYIPVAFRASGVDHQDYLNIYGGIANEGLNYWNVYRGFPEPLYAMLNWIVSIIFNDFQYVYIISAFISLFFVYLGFSRNIKKVDISICIWMFGVTYYFYMYGLVRYSIAIGILIYAHKYIDIDKKKYILWCITASGFHYSSLTMILVCLFIGKKSEGNVSIKEVNKFIFNILIILPISMIIIFILSKIFYNSAIVLRYKDYFNMSLNISALNGFVWIFPIIFIVLIFRTKYLNKMDNSLTYFKLFLIGILLILMSTFININRIVFLFFHIFYYFYGNFYKINFKYNQRKCINIIYNISLVIFGCMWVNRMIFNSIYWKPHIIPFSIITKF